MPHVENVNNAEGQKVKCKGTPSSTPQSQLLLIFGYTFV